MATEDGLDQLDADPVDRRRDRYSAVEDSGGRSPVPRAVVVAAVLVPVVLLAAALVLVRGIQDRSRDTAARAPLAVVPVEAPDADSPECGALLAELSAAPDGALGEARRVDFAGPAPAGTAAYRMPSGDPVVVRCGLPAPPEFRVDSALQQVDAVQWFRQQDPGSAVTGSTWVAVDRPRHVVVTLPDGSGTGAIQELSAAITRTMPAVPPRPAPLR